MIQLAQIMKSKNKWIWTVCCLVGLLSIQSTYGQSAYKEASNAFALYTQTGDIKNLDDARKHIENIYKTKRDSSKARVNVLRAMVMSSLAYADSSRTIELDSDPIDLTYETLGKIRKRDRAGYLGELNYVTQNLAAALIYRANKSLEEEEFEAAFADFSKVDELGARSSDVTYNLALLASRVGKTEEAIEYYRNIQDSGEMSAKQTIELANLYDQAGEFQYALSTLEDGRSKFPEDKDLLFLLIEKYADNEAFDAIVPIIDEAIDLEPENVDLNYLAGYANENAGNTELATRYYEKVLQLDPNNYESNLALGLIHLGDFLKAPDDDDAQILAQQHLLKANEVKPYEINALKSLALYYEKADDETQLDRVNLLLNQLTN